MAAAQDAPPRPDPYALGPTDLVLLIRHRPVLRLDPQCDFTVLAAEAATDNPGSVLMRRRGETIAASGGTPPLHLHTLAEYPDERDPRPTDHLAFPPDLTGESRRMERAAATRGRIYGRVVRGGERIWLQYWWFLLDNPKHLLGFGRHQGDWEMVQVGLNGKTQLPEALTYAQHDHGEVRAWEEAERFVDDPDRPVVYVATLSHASYFEAKTHPYFPGVDDTRDDGPCLADLPVVPFGPWAAWGGRWGATHHRVKLRGTSPPSPARQGLKWDDPAAWHARSALRKPHRLFGRLVHALGDRTYPCAPQLTADAPDDEGRVRVHWQKASRRPGRHLLLSLDDGPHVLASRVIVDPPPAGSALLRVPEGCTATTARASVYNALRQRSEAVQAPLPSA